MNFSDREYFPPRRKTRPVKVGRHTIGGDSPIVVQSMTKTDTRDVEKTVEQVCQMEAAGCEIVRLAVPDIEAAKALTEIRKRCPDSILVSDIHFQYKFALMALDAGIDKLRINPGNIGDAEKVRAVVRRAQEQKAPTRIGVNAGSSSAVCLKSMDSRRPRPWSKAPNSTSKSSRTWASRTPSFR